MKRLSVFIALLLSGWAIHAAAAEYSVAVDASPFTLWKARCNWLVMCATSSDDTHSAGLGARAAIWLPRERGDKSGLELGYARLGSNSGSKDYLLNPGCLILCAGATASWSNDASIAFVDLMGQAYLGPRAGIEAVTGKIGLYNANVTTSGTYTAGGPGYTRKVNSTGLMMGAAYGHHVSPQVTLTLSADLFFNVKLGDPINPNAEVSRLLLRLAVGAEYDF